MPRKKGTEVKSCNLRPPLSFVQPSTHVTSATICYLHTKTLVTERLLASLTRREGSPVQAGQSKGLEGGCSPTKMPGFVEVTGGHGSLQLQLRGDGVVCCKSEGPLRHQMSTEQVCLPPNVHRSTTMSQKTPITTKSTPEQLIFL